MEGPYLSPDDGPRGAHARAWIVPASLDDFKRRQDAADGRIVLVTLAPEVPGAVALIEHLVTTGVRVALGHTAATAQEIGDHGAGRRRHRPARRRPHHRRRARVHAHRARRANIRFAEEEVVKVVLENRAGELATVSAKLAQAGVNLRAIYLTGIVDDLVELAIVADNPKKARYALE
jgi:hypothetical protein